MNKLEREQRSRAIRRKKVGKAYDAVISELEFERDRLMELVDKIEVRHGKVIADQWTARLVEHIRTRVR